MKQTLQQKNSKIETNGHRSVKLMPTSTKSVSQIIRHVSDNPVTHSET